jgi:hypothetical protein
VELGAVDRYHSCSMNAVMSTDIDSIGRSDRSNWTRGSIVTAMTP